MCPVFYNCFAALRCLFVFILRLLVGFTLVGLAWLLVLKVVLVFLFCYLYDGVLRSG